MTPDVDALGTPEQRLEEAIKQTEIVANDTDLHPGTQFDLLVAIHDLEVAKARYERGSASDSDAEAVD